MGSRREGGLPYALLAIWATWWVGGRDESEIERVMMVSPLLMAATFATVSVATDLAVGHFGPFQTVAVLAPSSASRSGTDTSES